MSLIPATAVPFSGEDFTLDQSLRFNYQDENTGLNWTPTSAGNRKTWTFSCWVKRGRNSGRNQFLIGAPTYADGLYFQSDDKLVVNVASTNSITHQKFRDPTAWYHIVLAVDTTDGTAADRRIVYINGTRITEYSADYPPSQNSDSFINSAALHKLGGHPTASDLWFDGYMAEVHFIDGTQLTPTSFGETGTYGEWKPIEVDVTYGTNGFHLPFKQDYEVEGFSVTTYHGTSDYRYVGGVGFKPDLVMLKVLSGNGSWDDFDVLRGPKEKLHTNNTVAEVYEANALTSFTSDGFTMGPSGDSNHGSHHYLALCWDMGANTSTGFNSVLYTGNNTTQFVGGIGFSPDLVWLKSRTQSRSHVWFDTIRGLGKGIASDQNWAEATSSNNYDLTGFHKDGFNLGGAENWNSSNESEQDMVAYCWDMGGTSVANTEGSINSTVRANSAKGQSIVSWTGTGANATIGHGLGSTPELVILKNRDEARHWLVFHKDLNDGTDSGEYNLYLNLGAAETHNEGFWNDTEPTADVFSVGSRVECNGSADKFIAYCFHSVAGYSSIGSYTGNASATGPSVTTGFRPALVMFKKEDVANWFIFDNVRSDSVDTDINEVLQADSNRSESANGTGYKIDFNSNGFQIKASNVDINASGVKYRYIAFAGGANTRSTVNTTGSIHSRVKASTTYGQSIVKYDGNGTAGATVGHGLGTVPEMVIVKAINYSDNWPVHHASNTAAPETERLYLDGDGATYDDNVQFHDTLPTSSVFTIGNNDQVNNASYRYIAYCFDSVAGYSKFGGYTGDGGSSNTITIGFKPALVMIKNTGTGARPWVVFNGVRSNGLVWNDYTKMNENELEALNSTNRKITISDTGFTLGIDAWINENTQPFVYMAFADKREYAYWLDQSGNNNDWTDEFKQTDSDVMLDSPTNNFCTFNPLLKHFGKTLDPKEGLLMATCGSTSTSANHSLGSTMGVSSGKWYFEIMLGNTSYSHWSQIGVASDIQKEFTETMCSHSTSAGPAWGSAFGWGYECNSGRKVHGGQSSVVIGTAFGSTVTTLDVMGVAVDMDAGKIWFAENNTWLGSGDPAAGTNPAWDDVSGAAIPFVSTQDGSSAFVVANFGQDSSFAGYKAAQGNQDSGDIGDFYYTPPTDFKAWCTANMATPDVIPSEHFSIKLFDDGAGAKTGVGFQPDLVWFKSRGSAYSHQIYDAVRGTAKALHSDTTADETAASTGLTAFGSDGFTVGVDNSVRDTNGVGMVAWNWKAGGGAGSSNTNGSINTTTTSVNTAAGFSMSTWTGNATSGATIGHGLSKAPNLIISKQRSGASNWLVQHSDLGPTHHLELEVTGGKNTSSNIWNNTAPTATVFSVGNNAGVNGNGETYVTYCFHEVEGYSKFGIYTGNNSGNGPFIHLGFRPKYFMIKASSTTDGWLIYDSARGSRIDSNLRNFLLFADNDPAETEIGNIDFLSNGVKIRIAASAMNEVHNYIYLAFAETPSKYSNSGDFFIT